MSKFNGKIERRVVIVHVDDVDFSTSGENSEKKMQEITSFCVKMHEATGGELQKEKVLVCF